MNSGTVILLIFLSSVVVVGVITLILFRLVTRILQLKEVTQEGVVLREDGLEYLGFFGFGKSKIDYSEIESVEKTPCYAGPLTILFLRYGMAARWIGTRLFKEIVVIKLKGPRVFRYLLSTPKDSTEFISQLSKHIGG